MKPQIIKTAAPLVAETYSTTGVVMGTFDATDAGSNNALLLIVPHSSPTLNANDKITGVSFDGVAGQLIGFKAAVLSNTLQPRITAFIVWNPNKVIGNIVVTTNVTVTDSSSQVAVYPILLSNVSSSPVGNVVTTYSSVYDTTLNDTLFTANLSLQSSNSLVFGAYVGVTAARNTYVATAPTTTLYSTAINYPVNPDQAFWVGTQDITSSGAKNVIVTQTVYQDTAALLFFEILCSTPAPMLVLPYTINVGTNVTATFNNVSVVPSSITLTCGGLSQQVAITNNAGVYTLQVPTWLTNAVKMGFASATFTDNGSAVTAEFNYIPPTTLNYSTLTAVGSASTFIGWNPLPAIGDQIVWDPVTTVILPDTVDIEAYAAGTYNFKHINGTTGLTSSFNVTFGESAADTTIVTGSSTTSLVDGAGATVTFTAGLQYPIELRIRDNVSDTVTKQSSFNWNATTHTATYTVTKGFVAYNQPVELVALMNDGSLLTLTVTITGDATPTWRKAITLSDVVDKNSTSPIIDGLNVDGKR